ncbi:MAG TPA: hypothetical protein PLP01_08875 [Phycisphaerae bacterium]|nr:hypothetical protein [Phycisphaerae bacterium]
MLHSDRIATVVCWLTVVVAGLGVNGCERSRSWPLLSYDDVLATNPADETWCYAEEAGEHRHIVDPSGALAKTVGQSALVVILEHFSFSHWNGHSDWSMVVYCSGDQGTWLYVGHSPDEQGAVEAKDYFAPLRSFELRGPECDVDTLARTLVDSTQSPLTQRKWVIYDMDYVLFITVRANGRMVRRVFVNADFGSGCLLGVKVPQDDAQRYSQGCDAERQLSKAVCVLATSKYTYPWKPWWQSEPESSDDGWP